MSNGRERRRKERLDSKLFLELSNPASKDSKGRGVVLDVSLTGFGIETEADLEIGESLLCHLEIPIEINAKVVRRFSRGQVKQYGLKMVNQSLLDRLVMRKLLKGKRSTRKI